MNDAAAMSISDGFGDGPAVGRCGPGWERLLANDRGQAPSLDVIHGEKVLVVNRANLVDGNNVRVLKSSRGGGFALETLYAFGAGKLAEQHHLHRDNAVQV